MTAPEIPPEFSRTERVIGREAVEKLRNSSVAVFGIGGVGSYAAEALARAGVGSLALFDGDTVAPSNINRQIVALHSTVGRRKADVMAERVLDINPACRVTAYPYFFTAENADKIDFSRFNYLVDAVDMISAKLELAVRADQACVPLISCMGAGNKLDPTRFEVADIYQTSVCPLARVMRRELRTRGIAHLKVVYSKEPPLPPQDGPPAEIDGRSAVPGSVSFVPPVAGMILAGEVIKDLAGLNEKKQACSGGSQGVAPKRRETS
jgi:tRNA A37 threonylcarbamoyladenosine dehydratase